MKKIGYILNSLCIWGDEVGRIRNLVRSMKDKRQRTQDIGLGDNKNLISMHPNRNDLLSFVIEHSGLLSFKYKQPFILLFLCFFTLLLVKPLSTFSQAYAINTDLQRINIAMFEARDVYMEIDYNLYFDQTLRSQMKGVVKKNGRFLFQQVGPVTVVKNEKYSVFMHHEQKLLVVDANPVDKDPIKKEDLLRINVDTFKTWIETSELTENGNQRVVVFTLKKGEYGKIKIEYDPVTYFLKRLELYTRNKYTATDKNQYSVWMEVVFNQLKTGEKFPEDEFSEKKYITVKSNDLIVPLGIYKDYRLMNNLNKKIEYEKSKK